MSNQRLNELRKRLSKICRGRYRIGKRSDGYFIYRDVLLGDGRVMRGSNSKSESLDTIEDRIYDLELAWEECQLEKRLLDWCNDLPGNIDIAPTNPDIKHSLPATWHVYGLRIRRILNNDALLLRMFRTCCEPYSGPRVTLYRGDSLANFKSGTLGFSWTPLESFARMHAQHFVSKDSPAVVLIAQAESEAIICRLSFGIGELEHIVDVSRLEEIAIHQLVAA